MSSTQLLEKEVTGSRLSRIPTVEKVSHVEVWRVSEQNRRFFTPHKGDGRGCLLPSPQRACSQLGLPCRLRLSKQCPVATQTCFLCQHLNPAGPSMCCTSSCSPSCPSAKCPLRCLPCPLSYKVHSPPSTPSPVALSCSIDHHSESVLLL